MAQVEINWYENDVLLAIEDITDELLTKLAFRGEELAKKQVQANGQIDTGFMVNTIYAVAPGGQSNTGWESGEYESRKTGELVQRERVTGELQLEPHQAAIHCAAEYAAYQETRASFLYKAVERLQQEAGGIIQEVAR